MRESGALLLRQKKIVWQRAVEIKEAAAMRASAFSYSQTGIILSKKYRPPDGHGVLYAAPDAP